MLHEIFTSVADPETLFRCSRCGKWSHAQRMPRQHKRFIPNVSDLTEQELRALAYIEGLPVVGVEEPWYDEDGRSRGGVWVACGPFQTWVATPKGTA